jgi:excisionase family DNA binding protein
MTIKEVADRLGISENSVRRYCQAGRLGEKVGRQWIITEAEFARFVASDYTGEPGRPPKSDG